jgi:hypothetical protein
VVVEASSEVRNYDVRALLHRLDLTLVAWLDVLQVVLHRIAESHILVLSVLENPAGQSHIGIRIDEDLKVDKS